MKNTKKRILTGIAVSALLFSCSIKANAQSFELGARFYPTFTDLSIKSSSGGTIKSEVTLGYGFGGVIGFNFTEHIGLQAEVIYNSISQEYKEKDVVRNLHLKYVNIPLLFSLNTGRSKPINFNLVAGPQIGINIASDVSSSGGDGTVTSTAVLSVKKGDLGFAYGAGVDFGLIPSGAFRLGVGFRGVYGVLDISDRSKTKTTDSYYLLDRTHVKSYSAYIGVSFLIS